MIFEEIWDINPVFEEERHKKMAPENIWLSFSLPSLEMIDSCSLATMELAPFETSSAAASHHLYSFADNFNANGN